MSARRGNPSRGGSRPASALRPERWAAQARGEIAHLDIPADASRERSFEIYCSFTVMHRDAGAASHGLRVLVDGAHEWARRVPTHNGDRDLLDVRFRRIVAAGHALRISAIGEAEGAAPLGLSITAEED